MGIHLNNLLCLWNSWTTLTPRTSHAVLRLRQLSLAKRRKGVFPNISVYIRVLRNAETETSSHSGLVLLKNEAKWVMAVLGAFFSTSSFSASIPLTFNPPPPFHPAFLPILPFSHQPLLSYNLILTLLHLHTSMHLFQPLPRVESWETRIPEDVVGWSQLAAKHSHSCSLPDLPPCPHCLHNGMLLFLHHPGQESHLKQCRLSRTEEAIKTKPVGYRSPSGATYFREKYTLYLQIRQHWTEVKI